jgi:hypothetical protein
MLESLPVEQDWASGPAFAPSNLSPTYAQARQGGVGHGDLQASVLAGAQSYNPVSICDAPHHNSKRRAVVTGIWRAKAVT